MREHPRRGRALLARVHVGALHDRGHGVVEVGVGVDEHAVLAAHLGDHALEVALAVAHLGGVAQDLQAHRGRAGEGDRVHAGVAHERGADVALARQQGERVGRHAAGAQGLDEHEGAAGRLLGGLEDRGVAGGQRGRGHAAGDGDGEVPRRDDRGHAARAPAHGVALAGDLQQRRVTVELDRPARVVLEEVDGLAHVGVGLAPRLRALAHGQRGELGPALPHPRRRRDQRLRALGRRARAPVPEPPLGRLHGAVDVGRGGHAGGGDDAVGVSGVGGAEALAGAALVADPHRRAHRQPPLEPGHAVDQRGARGRPAQLEDGLVGERLEVGHGAASSSSIGAPRCRSERKDSLAVFSSRRRTR